MSTDAPHRTVLVTGAAGYVGGALTRRLLADEATNVIVVDWCRMAHGDQGVRELIGHPRLEFVQADVRDLDTLRPLLSRSDAVVHLAAIVGDPAGKRDPDLTRSINIDASTNLIDASGEADVDHLVFVSTCSNYGVSDTSTLVTEDAELNPVSLYAGADVDSPRLCRLNRQRHVVRREAAGQERLGGDCADGRPGVGQAGAAVVAFRLDVQQHPGRAVVGRKG